MRPEKEIRASYTETTIRVYQAYSSEIASSTLEYGGFQSPPFSMSRMTWIKPSFLWMMYRAGWGYKDPGQSRILAIDITRDGFEWALTHACLSCQPKTMTKNEWGLLKAQHPVRIQWDPERDFFGAPLPYRSIQIGLRNEAIKKYTSEWITKITEITELAHTIYTHIQMKNYSEATRLLPLEKPYIINSINVKNIHNNIFVER